MIHTLQYYCIDKSVTPFLYFTKKLLDFAFNVSTESDVGSKKLYESYKWVTNRLVI